MKRAKYNSRIINVFIVLALFCFALLIYRIGILSLSPKVEGRDLKKFAESRSVVSKVLPSTRGNIYDRNGEPLAINVSSYTLIAYIDHCFKVKNKGTVATGTIMKGNLKINDEIFFPELSNKFMVKEIQE